MKVSPMPKSAQMADRRARRDGKLRKQRVSLLDRLLLLCSKSRRVDGLWIGAAEGSSTSGLALDRVVDALCLIKTHDPHRYSRLLRDLDRVWVRFLPGARGRYSIPLRACELNPRFVLDAASSAELIAATIVHEATHARLWDCGFGYEEAVRARVENVCVRSELAFAAKLPSGQAVRARAEQKLAAPREFYSNVEVRERHVGNAVQALRDLGLPGWLLRARLAVAGALQALRVLRVTLKRGRAHPAMAIYLDDLARLHEAQGDFTRAQRDFGRVLAIREQTLGPDHVDIARSLSSLARVLQARGDLAGARPLLERALAICEKALGSDHAGTMRNLDELARLHEAQGDLAMARPLFERVVSIREKVLGPDHPHTAMSLNYLADLLRAQGDLVGARRLLERVLAIDEKALGPDHPDTATDLSNLGGLLQEQGDFAAARPLLERALKIDEKALGAEHPDTAIDLSMLARLLSKTGHWNEAESYFRRAIAIAEEAHGPRHPDTHRYQSHYARLLLDTGRGAEALALAKAALAAHQASFGTNHAWTEASARVTADALDALGRTEEAAGLRAGRALAAHTGQQAELVEA
jgi:tetratricopeptide (TPR) repeat protein